MRTTLKLSGTFVLLVGATTFLAAQPKGERATITGTLVRTGGVPMIYIESANSPRTNDR